MNVLTFIDIPKLLFIYEEHLNSSPKTSFPITVSNYNYDTISFYIANIGDYIIYTGRNGDYSYRTYFTFAGQTVNWFTKSDYNSDTSNFSEKQWNYVHYQYYWIAVC